MATAIARLAGLHKAVSKHPRTAPWPVAHRRGHIRSAQGESTPSAVADVSAHGCSVKCMSGSLRSGQFVSVSLEHGSAMQAVVRWVRDEHAGLEFLRPIPPDYGDWRALINVDC